MTTRTQLTALLLVILSSSTVFTVAEEKTTEPSIEIDDNPPAEANTTILHKKAELPACNDPCIYSTGHIKWNDITLFSAERKRYKRKAGGGYEDAPQPRVENIAPYTDRFLLGKVRELFQVDKKDAIYDIKGLSCQDDCWCMIKPGVKPLPESTFEDRLVEFEVSYDRESFAAYPPDESWRTPPLNVLYWDPLVREWIDMDPDFVERGPGFMRRMPGARGRYRFDIKMRYWAKVKAGIRIEWKSYPGRCEKFL